MWSCSVVTDILVQLMLLIYEQVRSRDHVLMFLSIILLLAGRKCLITVSCFGLNRIPGLGSPSFAAERAPRTQTFVPRRVANLISTKLFGSDFWGLAWLGPVPGLFLKNRPSQHSSSGVVVSL